MDQMKLEELPFNLVDMTIEEFYGEYESIPTGQESVIDVLDPNDNLEMEDEVGELLEDSIGNIEYDFDLSDAESNIPLSQLRIRNNIQKAQTVPIWKTNFMGHDIGDFTDSAGLANIVNQDYWYISCTTSPEVPGPTEEGEIC
ncbi:hypothetical protein CBL_13818 [Carabus blaptoides fortunei]